MPALRDLQWEVTRETTPVVRWSHLPWLALPRRSMRLNRAAPTGTIGSRWPTRTSDQTEAYDVERCLGFSIRQRSCRHCDRLVIGCIVVLGVEQFYLLARTKELQSKAPDSMLIIPLTEVKS